MNLKLERTKQFVEKNSKTLSIVTAIFGILVSFGLVFVPIVMWNPIDYLALGIVLAIFLLIIGVFIYLSVKIMKSNQKLENE